MTHQDDVAALLRKVAPQAICDDCLADRLKFSQRQTANIISRKLAVSPHYDRDKNICSVCSGTKMVIRRKNNDQPLTPKVKSGNSPTSRLTERYRNPSLPHLANAIEIGFKRVGMWSLMGDTLQLNLYEMQKSTPALYAFVNAQHILYVGKTSQYLAKRLYFYAKPRPSQSTNIRVNANLRKMLKADTEINIYGYSPKSIKKIGNFNLDLPAGLENDIIRQIQPAWNIRK